MTDQPTFNLLDEPWIPVRTHAGEVIEVSLSETLLNARNYAALAETSPPNLIALYRMLLAALHRALTTQHGQWRDTDRARWFREGLPEAPIRAYLEHWRERFWLFHPSEPFMQVAALAIEPATANAVFHSNSVSINRFYGPEMFDHMIFDSTPQPVTSVITNMLGYYQFVPGGFFPGKKLKGSDKAGALVSTAAVMPLGNNISETLLLGLHPFDARRLNDLPSWERPAPTIAQLLAEPTLATGPNDRYTRQSRAVLFNTEGAPAQIQWLRLAAGVALQEDPNAPDTMACYRINKDGKAIRVAFNEGRALWRELPSLVPDPGHSHDIPPAILEYATNLFNNLGDSDAPVNVLTAGITFESGQAKPLRWRTEQIELPQKLVTQPDAANFLRIQIRFAENVWQGLALQIINKNSGKTRNIIMSLRNVLTDMITQTMPDPKRKETAQRARDILANGPASAVFFSAAERALPRLMQQIASGDFDAAARDWKGTLAEAAKQSWAATRRSLGDSPAVLRADARTWPRFIGLLNTLVPPAPAATPTSEEVPA